MVKVFINIFPQKTIPTNNQNPRNAPRFLQQLRPPPAPPAASFSLENPHLRFGLFQMESSRFTAEQHLITHYTDTTAQFACQHSTRSMLWTGRMNRASETGKRGDCGGNRQTSGCFAKLSGKKSLSCFYT